MTKNILTSNKFYFLLIIIISVFVLNTNPLKNETLAPMDLLLTYSGWQNVDIEYSNVHPERSDILDSKLPQWISAKEEIYKGNIPFWNYQTGTPSMSLFTNSLLTPAFITFLTIKDNAIAFYFSNLINVLIGMIGMFLFLSLFFDKKISIFGSIVFIFSGFNASWFFWHHVDTSIWIPWLLYFSSLFFKYKNIYYGFFLILSMVLLNLGGFPMVAVMGYMTLGIFILIYILYNNYKLKEKIYIIGIYIFFILIAMILSFPFIYSLIDIFNFIGGIGYRHGGTNYLLSDFKLFINPYIYGLPRVEKTLYVGIIALLFSFVSIYLSFKKHDFILRFSLILFVFSTIISFSLIHPDIIRMIPTLNSNPWNRFNLLIGFSLAILSTYAFNYLVNKIKSKYLSILFIITVLLLQIYDQKILFNKFNHFITNDAFYPKTNSIKYIKENIKPFQYIVADGGYLISGTLGAYGINEWYAHSFRSKDEKNVLNSFVKNAFQSPTASSISSCSDIDLKSKYIDLLNIKYLLCTRKAYMNLWNNRGAQKPAPYLPKYKLEQEFDIKKNIKIKGIRLLLATYANSEFNSTAKLDLYHKNEIISTSILDSSKIRDNRWADFTFKNKINLSKGKYSIRLTLLSKNNKDRLTVWSNIKNIKFPLLVNDKYEKISFKMSLIKDDIQYINSKYSSLKLEPNITIIKNNNVKGSAYFINNLKSNIPSYKNIKITKEDNNIIYIDYKGVKKGFIVLPMKLFSGWRASIGDKEVKIEKFLKILPAIKVNGSDTIKLEYYPTNFNLLLFISSMVWMIIFILIIRRKRIDETNNTNTML